MDIKKDLEIGSIILLMNQENSIYKVLITEKNVTFKSGEITKEFEYRGYTYPFGFIGVDSITHFNTEDIYAVIYDSEIMKSNTNILDIGAKIKFKNENYLILGKNVANVGKEAESNYFSCMSIDNPNSYEIKVIKESSNVEIVKYGYEDEEFIEFVLNRFNRVEKALRTYNRLLPIGSVIEVEMKEIGLVEFTIVARNIVVENNKIDYVAVPTMSGFIGTNKLAYVQKEQVKEIKYVGYWNEQESEYMFEILIDKGLLQRG